MTLVSFKKQSNKWMTQLMRACTRTCLERRAESSALALCTSMRHAPVPCW
uniref:Uncharacterized protein n=1 Tax=Globisporangium ultimum (strain ATCC 200006 / CBS 805.95 / DAOM BR144) TaxID=431595 RepID=K3WQW6_GLOUD